MLNNIIGRENKYYILSFVNFVCLKNFRTLKNKAFANM